MARSVSRARKSASKSPARVKKHVASPKSEPKKKKAENVKAQSRSRSASRGRKAKKAAKSPKSMPKSISRSVSRGRQMKLQNISPKKLSPKPTPRKAESARTPAATKTPAQKTPSLKTPSVKTPSVTSILRPSRSVERKVFTSTPNDAEIRQRFLRHESASRSPVKVTPKKSVSAIGKLYNRACGSAKAAGRSVCGASRAAGCAVVRNRREILVTIALLALVSMITYFVLYTDPAKTRAFIHSIPIKMQAWYQKHIVRK